MKMNFLDFCYDYILRPLCFVGFSFFYKVKVIGRENVPRQQGFILAANHCSFLDAPFIAWILRQKPACRKPIYWIISKMIYATWYFRPLCIISRGVPVNGSTKGAEALLESGKVVGIFPYGGICCDIIIKKGRRGVAVLALKTGASVLPCYIEATLDQNKKVNFTPKIFKPLKLIIGKPLYFEKVSTEQIPEDVLDETLQKIIAAINNLLLLNGSATKGKAR